MKIELRCLGLLLAGAFLSGCVSLPECMMMESVPGAEVLGGVQEAREAIGLLKDTNAFPYANIENIDFTNHTVTLKGFAHTNEKGSSVGVAGDSTLGVAINETNSFYTFDQTRDQAAIWFSDIRAVTLEHIKFFDAPANTDVSVERIYSGKLIQTNEGYRCVLHLKDGQGISFYSPFKESIQKVAEGFSLLSGKALTAEVIFNRVGINLKRYEYPQNRAVADEIIVEILIGSPADMAAVPLGQRVIAVDGIDVPDNGEAQHILDTLTLGPHSITTKSPGSMFSTHIWVVDLSPQGGASN